MYNFGSEGAIYSCSKSIVCTGLFFHTSSGTLADSPSPLPAQQLRCQTSESTSVLAGNPGHLLRPSEGHRGGAGRDFLPASLYSISSSPGSLGSAVWLSGRAVPCCHHECCGGKEEGHHIYVSNVIKLRKLSP